MKKSYVIWIAVVMVISVAVFLFNSPKADTPALTATSTSVAGTSTLPILQPGQKIVTVGGITYVTDAKNSGGLTIEQVMPTELPKPIPPLNASISFTASSNISPDAQKIIISQITSLVKKLTANPGVVGDWLSLGQYRKIAGEYAKAREAWEYAKLLNPADKTAYNNLADLYQYYLKDYKKAEFNWKKTVELDSAYIPGYRGLYDLYTQNQHSDKAKVAVEMGISANPHSIDLFILLGNYYVSQGQKNLARVQYEKALTEAKMAKEKSLIESIQKTIDSL